MTDTIPTLMLRAVRGLKAQVEELTRERDGLMNACDKLEDRARRAWDDGHMAGREKSPTLQENRELRERAEQAEAVAACEQREADHRLDLWISHGHTAALYGDDGEMQCAVLPFVCDFKRDPLPRLVNHVRAALLAQVEELKALIEELTRERDAAREWVRRMHSEAQTLTCVYCGQAYPPGTAASGSEVLTEHIKVCEKHPLRQAEARLARVVEALTQATATFQQITDTLSRRCAKDEPHDHEMLRQAKAGVALLDAAFAAAREQPTQEKP